LSDRETFGFGSRVGEIDLAVGWRHGDESGTATGSSVPVRLGGQGAKTTRLTLSLPGEAANPAAVWLRADCPVPAGSPLASALDVTVGYCDGEAITSGSLAAVATDLRGGVALDGGGPEGCLDPESGRCLEVSWDLDGEGSDVSWDLTFAAVQCRYDDGSNPFAGVPSEPCAEAPPCECCVAVGKVEPENEYFPPGTYAFDETNDALGDYELRVTESAEKDGGETVGVAFEVVPRDGAPAPRLCGVDVSGAGKCRRYRRDGGAAGPETGQLLYGPKRPGKSYPAISHVVVRLCADGDDCDEPRWATAGPCGSDDDRDGTPGPRGPHRP
jgi:hypothetical protein